MNESNLVEKCRLCGHAELDEILDLGRQYYTGRFPSAKEKDPPLGELAISRCRHCNLVQLKHFHIAEEMYGMTYGYRSSITQTMCNHLMGIRDLALDWTPAAKNSVNVLDIGSNDGTLLHYFSEHTENLVGIDPCAVKHLDNYPETAQAICDFFSSNSIKNNSKLQEFDVVTSIAMFYDLDNPVEFARDIRSVLTENGIWITEQTHSHTLLENNCYDSICHEHTTYLSLAVMEEICKRADLKILDIHTNDINGGSFCLVIAKNESSIVPNQKSIDSFRRTEEGLDLQNKHVWNNFRLFVEKHRIDFGNYIKNAHDSGKTILGYGASTKGNVLLQYCNINKSIMKAILERDPYKYGFETPGTRIPIVSEDVGRAMNPDILVVFPWHFKKEIIEREREFLENGGILLFPLPVLEAVTKESLQS